MVNLDPFAAHQCVVKVPMAEMWLGAPEGFRVRDLLTDSRYTWIMENYVRLDPTCVSAHILVVEKEEANE